MDPAPLDQLEKCREPDYRHLGGRSRRCDEMSFLLYRSVRALSCIRLVRSCPRYGTAHGVDRDRRGEREPLQEPSELTPWDGSGPASPGEPAPPDAGGQMPKQGRGNRVARDPVV